MPPSTKGTNINGQILVHLKPQIENVVHRNGCRLLCKELLLPVAHLREEILPLVEGELADIKRDPVLVRLEGHADNTPERITPPRNTAPKKRKNNVRRISRAN